MDTLTDKLFRGDLSVLELMCAWVELPQEAPSGDEGRKLYAFLGSLLCRVGAELRKNAQDSVQHAQSSAAQGDCPAPPPAAWTALRILATVGARQGPDGVACRAALLSLGICNCRGMVLDAYFTDRSDRESLVTLLCVVVNIFGCRFSDLIRKRENINYMEVSAIPSVNVRVLFQDTSATSAPSNSGSTTRARHREGQSDGGNGGALATPALQQSFRARMSPIPLRGAMVVPILGVLTDLNIDSNRRYRMLPKKPASTPYAMNPLFDPHIKSSENTLLAAQFPTPVARFSNCFGPGCTQRLPSVESFYKRRESLSGATEDAWDAQIARALHTPVRIAPVTGALNSSVDQGRPHGGGHPAEESTSFFEALASLVSPTALAQGAQVQAGAEKFLAAARAQARGLLTSTAPCRPESASDRVRVTMALGQRLHTAGMSGAQLGEGSAGMPAERARCATWPVDMPLSSTNGNADSATTALNARAVSSELLMEYLEVGKLLGWGENTFHALGPLESKACRNPPKSTATLLPSPHSSFRPPPHHLHPSFSALLESPPVTTDRPPRTSVPAPSLPLPGTTAANIATSGTVPSEPSRNYCFCPSSIRRSEGVVDVACGTLSTHIVTRTGLLLSCGAAHAGQLGVGEWGCEWTETGTERFLRTCLSRDEQVVATFAGCSTAAAITRDGHVYCWGANEYGQCLRQRDAARVLTPIRFKSGKFRPIALSFGSRFAGVLYDDGLVGVWGACEMLGRPIPREAAEPALVPGNKLCVRKITILPSAFDAPVALLRMGASHIAVISRAGSLYTWGEGFEGRLGHGSDRDEETPRAVEGLQHHIALDVSCGCMHTAVVVATGDVFAFGENRYGQLGVRGLQARRTPAHVSLPARAVAVQCGLMSTAVLLETGDVMACGPVGVAGVGLGEGRVFISPRYILQNYITLRLTSGPTHSIACAVQRTVALMRVGHSPIEELSRMEGISVRSGVRHVAVGAGFILVLSENGTMVALGRGEQGQLGIGEAMRPSKPGEVTVLSSFESVRVPTAQGVEFVSVTCGPDFVFALDQSARVYGWGNNGKGLLLLPESTTAAFEPTPIAAYDGHDILQLACGVDSVAALTDDGEVLMHGEYMYCGLSSATESPTRATNRRGSVRVLKPSAVPGLRQVVAIAAGHYHTVAMTAACVVFAWGKGVLGSGAASPEVAFAPVKVALSHSIRKLGCGPRNTFAITDAGELYVWGGNAHGQCGVASCVAEPPPAGEEATGKGPANDALEAPSDTSVSVVVTPTLAARGVRDAAFAAKFGLVLFEDGHMCVSGELRHGGRNYRLRSFHDTPQPVFSVDVNTAQRCPANNHSKGNGAGESGGSDWGSPYSTGPRGRASGASSSNLFASGERRQLAEGEAFFTPSRSSAGGGQPRADPLGSGGTTTASTVTTSAPTEEPTRDTVEEGVGGERWHVTRESPSLPHAPSASTTTNREQCGGAAPDSQRRLSAGPREAHSGAGDRPPPVPMPPPVAGMEKAAPRRPIAATTVAPSWQMSTDARVPLENQSALHPTAAASSSLSPQPSAFTGLRCFGGWDQIFAVVEKHRPAPADVRLAQRGMQVYLRQREIYEDNIT